MKPKQSSSLTTIILALFVVLPTAISGCIDGRIKNYQEQLLVLEIQRSNYIQLGAYHGGRVNSFELLEALIELAPKLDMKPSVLADTISKSDAEEEQLFRQYKSGHLTAAQYMQEIGNSARRKHRYYATRIEQVSNEIASLHGKPSYVFGLKRLLQIVQVIGVILVVLINFLNLRQADA